MTKTNQARSDAGAKSRVLPPCRMFIDIESLLLDSVPPDDDFLDLIEKAFLDGQIDGEEMNLACLLLATLSRNVRVGVGINQRQ